MTSLFNFLPKVTTSKEEFLKHIEYICKTANVPDNIEYKWISIVENDDTYGYYFFNVMFVCKLSFLSILHELIHHFAKEIRGRTIHDFWYIIDEINDIIAHLIDEKRKNF